LPQVLGRRKEKSWGAQLQHFVRVSTPAAQTSGNRPARIFGIALNDHFPRKDTFNIFLLWRSIFSIYSISFHIYSLFGLWGF
jgi:hypothetical protein